LRCGIEIPFRVSVHDHDGLLRLMMVGMARVAGRERVREEELGQLALAERNNILHDGQFSWNMHEMVDTYL
jgi:hypothetical protein